MKKILQNILALVVFTTTVLPAFAYDFKVDGIYYNIRQDGQSVQVTRNGDNYYIGDVVIPELVTYNGNTYNVISIGDHAFERCESLTSIEIPNSVTSIGGGAFFSCSSLTSIKIPNSVTLIAERALELCSNLVSINIPNSVTFIGNRAFRSCSSLTSVEIPNSVTYIGIGAFDSCSSLTSVNIPNSVSVICAETFQECSGLTSVNIPNSVTKIDNAAFCGCISLKSINIPNAVTEIWRDAFSYCDNLTTINIPGALTYFDKGTFEGCRNLTSIYYNSDVLLAGDDNLFGDGYVFEEEVYEQATLYLTEAGLAMSNDVSPWKYFVHKEVFEFSGIKNIDTDCCNDPVEYYNLNGIRSNVDNLTPGLYIRKQGNTTAKVFVK